MAKMEAYHPSKRANKFKVIVKRIDAHRDLALLEHEIPPTEYFSLEKSDRPIVVGDETTALGYPHFGPGDGLNLRKGVVASLPTKSAVRLIEVTQKLSSGMSGGPILDAENKVIGIIHKGGHDEDRDFAIHVAVLSEWLSL